jgi:hypothetical protein
MNNLSEKFQERVDKWRKKPTAKLPQKVGVRFVGKGDMGDVSDMEQWERERQLSLLRK